MTSGIIVIPARYGSTRFPGKPLADLGGQSMLSRAVKTALNAAEQLKDITINVIVATDDERIKNHAHNNLNITAIMTSDQCETGSDRVFEAVKIFIETENITPDFIINLQGDAPFTPISVITEMAQSFASDSSISVLTPVCQLDWDGLDQLRDNKKTTPFSGTTAIVNDDKAIWFSKNIIPAIRKEKEMRINKTPCPIYQHIGLYGYTPAALEKFCTLPPSHYEQLEGLEQLRFIENNIDITVFKMDADNAKTIQSGIDTPEDLDRANAYLKAQKT